MKSATPWATSAPKSLFRYSGNKGRMLKHLRPPPPGTLRIVEPFLGSGSYTLSYGLPGYGIDADERVISLWKYLQQVTPEELRDLGAWYSSQKEGVNISECPFGYGAQLYLKINVCGAYVGQWSSTTTYPQHSLPVEKTVLALENSRKVRVAHGSWEEAPTQPGDAVFFDPPYLGTKGNYKGEDSFSPEGLEDWVLSQDVPVLFTYGEGAPELFPNLEWELATIKKVPRLRGGGTVERREWVSYRNWVEPVNTLNLFGE